MPSSQDNNDHGDDVHVHHVHVEPQSPNTTRQTAVEKAADTVNQDVKDVRPTMPVGTSNGPQDESNKIDKRVEGSEQGGGDGEVDEGVEGERMNGGADEKAVAVRGLGEIAMDQTTDDEDVAAPASSPDDDGGDVNVHHTYVAPTITRPVPYHVPPPPNRRSPPLSMLLEGENGQKLSRCADEAATHQVETTRHELTTQQPRRMPYDQRSNGEGRGLAVGHREAAGGRDNVEGSNDERQS
ncbi:hypothetical protein BDN67DRAFT_1015934 [Paxillus ammoniavirescens]|nr:hypothetical protein BDN67DRAFT_1015934 [Paxillus ammoniavirescens]